MTSRAKLLQRIAALEAQARSGMGVMGLDVVHMLTECHQIHFPQGAEVSALEVGPSMSRRRVARNEGESIEALERRANPAGDWRAMPSPIFVGEAGETEACEMYRLMLCVREMANYLT